MVEHPIRDVRCIGFASKSSLDDACAWLDRHPIVTRWETVELNQAFGRILADSVVSPVHVPHFPRAMMDGIATQARCIQSANPSRPVTLQITGESFPGRPWMGELVEGTGVRVMTGAPMPSGADVVIPWESTHAISQNEMHVIATLPAGRNLGDIGEDVAQGEVILSAGRRLRAQDIGVLSSLGIGSVAVRALVRVSVIVTGNELLPAGTTPYGFQITDANGPMLVALACRDGGEPTAIQMVGDNPEQIERALQLTAEVVLVTGGTSVGAEDFVPMILAKLGELAIHGVAMRPGAPAGLGRLGSTLVALLPGNPVACLAAYDLLIGRAIRTASGRGSNLPYPQVTKTVGESLPSAIDRVDYIRVNLQGDSIVPVRKSGASRLSSTTRADGFVIIPAEREMISAGETIDVFLYEELR